MNGRWTNCNIIVNIRGYSFVTLTSMNLSLFYTHFISVVLSMWLCKNNFSPPSLVVYSFATPPMKLKRGQQIPWGLLIANHLDQSLWCANQKQWPTVTTLFSASAHHAGPFISHRKPCTHTESNQHIWTFFIQLNCAGSHTEHLWRCSYI